MSGDLHQQLLDAFALLQAGDLRGGLLGFDSVLAADPNNFDAAHGSGVTLYQLGQFEDAATRLECAIALRPESFDARSNLALALMDQGRRADALVILDQVVAGQPDRADARAKRAACLNEMERFADALVDCDIALASAPDTLSCAVNRGVALLGLDQNDAALTQFHRLAQQYPLDVNVWCGLGQAQAKLRQLIEAERSYRRAIGIEPNHVATCVNLAALLSDCNSISESIALAERAAALAPAALEAHMTLGMVLMRGKRYVDAIGAYLSALKLAPNHGAALYSLGLCHLLLGELRRGFELYENRWHSTALQLLHSESTAPMLRPDTDVLGRTVLLWNDQGYGDAIQMARYASVLTERGAKVIVQAQPPLVRLFASAQGIDLVVPTGAMLPVHDYQSSFLSLPWVQQTEVGSIPPPLEIIERKIFLTQPLVLPSVPYRIGVAWSGNPAHVNDRRRSLSLKEFARAFDQRLHIVVLQREVRQSERDELARLGWLWRPEAMQDFAATAALIDQTDLVVTVDTAIAHLAGSLGKRTSLLVPFAPDWRWWGEDTNTEWYKSVQIYRQASVTDWHETLDQLRKDLQQGGVPTTLSATGDKATTKKSLRSMLFPTRRHE